jgi:phage gp46-like protein
MDFLTVWTDNPVVALTPAADWVLDPTGDLATDDTLLTSVLISLFTDRLANADDVLPDKSGDRRGFWGDDYPDPDLAAGETQDLIGSRFWLLQRAKATQATLNAYVAAAREALQWMIDDGVAATVDVKAWWSAPGVLKMKIAIGELDANGNVVSRSYAMEWKATLAN